METVKTKPSANFRLIPLKGIESIGTALDVFASNLTIPVRIIDGELVRDVSDKDADGHPVGPFRHAVLKVGDRSKIVTEILKEAKTALREKDTWCRQSGFEAMSTPFLQTTVYVGVIDRTSDMYGLSIYSTLLGEKMEIKLAEYLKIERV